MTIGTERCRLPRAPAPSSGSGERAGRRRLDRQAAARVAAAAVRDHLPGQA